MKPEPALAAEAYCYLTTTGRRSGIARTIEIWFALEQGVLYMLSGGRERSDWVRNLARKPQVSVRIGKSTFEGVARVVEPDTPEDALARRLLVEKYHSGHDDLSSWGREALPVAVDFSSD